MGSKSSSINGMCVARPGLKSQNSEDSTSHSVASSENPEANRKENPFQSKFLTFSQSISGSTSMSGVSQVEVCRQKIMKRYGGKKITKLEIYKSPIEVPFYSISSSSGALKHWEIIATIEDLIFWVISFGADGQQNQTSLEKEQLIKRRKQNLKSEDIQFSNGLLVKNLLQAIEDVKHKEYSIGGWNCQLFVDHIRNKVKSI